MPKTSPEESFRSRLAVAEKRAWLRPMGTGETIDTALRVYQRAAWTVLRVTAVPLVVCWTAVVFVQAVVVPGLFMTHAQGNLGQEVVEVVVALALGVLVAAPMFCLGLGRAMGSTVGVVTDILHGRPIDAARAVEAGSRSTGAVSLALASTLVASLAGLALAGLVLLFGMWLDSSGMFGVASEGMTSLFAVLAVVVGCIAFPIVWLSRGLAPVVAVVEGQGGRRAVRRSRMLMKPYSGHPSASVAGIAVGLLILLVGVPLVASLELVFALTGIGPIVTHWNPIPGFGQLVSSFLDALPVYVAIWLLTPLWSTAMTLLYFDRIVRLEAYDVRELLEDVNRADRRAVLLR